MLRKVLLVFLILVVLLPLVVSCSVPKATPQATTVGATPAGGEATTVPEPAPTQQSATATATAAPEEPFVVNGVTLPMKRSETVVMNQTNFNVFDSFNPLIPSGAEFAAGYWQIANEYLWYVNYATGEVIPWLAESYSYNDDYTELTIKIRQGVTWNDGEPFTAHDVAFTLNLFKNDETLSSGPDQVSHWKEVVATDDYTLVIRMSESRPREHYNFYCRICTGQVILPKHIWEGKDVKTFKNNPPVTTGPYMLDKVYPEQKVFVWKRNENYWNKAKYFPQPKYVVYRTDPGGEQTIAEAKAGNVDSFSIDYKTFHDNPAAFPDTIMVTYMDPCPRGAFMNAAQPPLDKPEFRRAMSMLMNREKWAANLWIPPSQPAKAFWADYRNMDPFINEEANEKWGILEYDPEEAMRLLESIGYRKEGNILKGPDGKPVTIEVSTPADPGGAEYLFAQDFVEELKAIGIDASLKNYEGDAFWNIVDNGTYQIGFWWLCGATIDPLELWGAYTCENVVPAGEYAAVGNTERLCDKELDDLLGQLQRINADSPEAHDLYMQTYDVFMRDAVAVPLVQTLYSVNYSTRYWDNVPTDDNLYTVPFNWWGQIIFMLFNLKAKGQ